MEQKDDYKTFKDNLLTLKQEFAFWYKKNKKK